MTELLDPQVTVAAAVARHAAAVAGCDVEELHQLADLAAVTRIFAGVWTRSGGEQILPLEALRALTHAGNYAAGAFVSGELVGAIVGFRGERDGVLDLHSHIMGLVPAARGRGIGYALKQHQRAWALERDLSVVTWTFDPLVRANAYLNLTKLGAVADTYLTDFYGPMTDRLNAGAETDRLLVTWRLRSRRAVLASGSPDHARDEQEAPLADVLLDADDAGRPRLRTAGAGRLRCHVPEDIIALRRTQPAVARDWRLALRDTLGAAVGQGYVVTGMTRDGWYLLERDVDEAGA
ncbi:MAG TPA: GNAT family N-acetyltransferase [Egicoccus sp.]|nr:GNAT family N-acetyltransferase [Egicoccus sp.]HSK24582.1 GNAT family N-acetyltransferase [Egicoccus sp.]